MSTFCNCRSPSLHQTTSFNNEPSALTLEFLETAFYQQGFAQFPASDFQAIGLSSQQISDLQSIGATEQVHVTTLLSAIAGVGTQPVAPCQYNFGFTTAQAMVATASVLENIGVSALVNIPLEYRMILTSLRYLGAAPLITTPSILTVAAEIVTVEARHQTFIRAASQVAAVPSAFDTPLGIRSVFTLATGFISSCPTGSNLAITPFAPLNMTAPTSGSSNVTAGATIQLETTATGGTFCSFTNAGQPGGTTFSPFANGVCAVPQDLAGLVYVHITNADPLTGVLADAITLAGPIVMVVS